MYPNIIGLGKVLRRMLDHEISSRMDFIELQKYISDNNLLRNVFTLLYSALIKQSLLTPPYARNFPQAVYWSLINWRSWLRCRHWLVPRTNFNA